MPAFIEHKLGNTFSRTLTLPDDVVANTYAGWELTCQIRTLGGELLDDIAASWANSPICTIIQLFRAAVFTAVWTPGPYKFHVQIARTSDGFITSTETVGLVVLPRS